MTEESRDLVRLLQQQERQQVNESQQLPPAEPPSIHYTELGEASPGSPITREWNLYRREIGRLLAEGLEGKWVLIKDDQIIGTWDTQEEADRVRLQRFLLEPVLLKQILSREPVVRGGGYFRRCRS